jgi:conjugative relaxase-like TrwC/TraI family protein
MIRASGALTATQAKDYYEQEYSKGDYYTEDGKAVPGQWSGRGAEWLGFQGDVEKEVFEALLEGKVVPGGDPLIPGEVGTGKHRAGWDFTCSPEKSVSIMALVGGDQGIVEDVTAANRKAMAELERFALGKDRERNLETTGNLVIASFRHETSRRLDPQLHIHNVVMNLTRRSDGKWVGLETREMYAAQAFLKSAFHADLARRLRARGYDVEIREGGVATLRDIPKSLVDAFSQRRRKDIEPYLAATGKHGARAAEIAALQTRNVKDRDIDPESLRRFWKDTAKGQGVDLRALQDRARQVPSEDRRPLPPEARKALAREALAFASEHLSERKAVFTGQELLGTALRKGMASLVLEEVREALDQARDLVRVEGHGSPSHRYTTRQALALELQNIGAMRRSRGAGRSVLDGNRFDPKRPLSEGQLKVANHILGSKDQVLAVEGKAGAGKTYTLQAVVEEAAARGWRVRGFAPDTSAVRTLSEEAGLEARTLAALAREKVRPEKDPGPQLWLVDEAGKMPSQQAAVLFQKARESGAKVVLVGDRLQHAAVEAGMPFAYLQEAGLEAVRLDEIRRQRDDALRAVVVHASEGRTREAAASLEALGKVVEHRDPVARHAAVVKDYLATPHGQTCLVIAPSNEERRDLNRRVREALIEAGTVDKASFRTTIRVSRGLTLAEKKEAQAYQVGDWLTFQRGSRLYAIPQGATGTVTAVDGARRTVAVELEGGRKAVFAPARYAGADVSGLEIRRFAVGDRIQYREAQKPEGRRIQGQGFRIANGDTAIIRKLDLETGRARVELEGSRRQVDLDLGRVQPVDHAYALTSHASQGRTVDRSLVVVDTSHSRELVNRQQFYVSISRARQEAKVYTSSREELGAAVGRDAEKASALALVKGRSRKEADHEPTIGAGSGGAGTHGAGGSRPSGRSRERSLGGAPGGPAGRAPEPALPGAGHPGPSDRAAGRVVAPPDPVGVGRGGPRRILDRLDRSRLGNPGGPEPGAPGSGRGPAAAGGRSAGLPAEPGRGPGRGHRSPGSRSEEPSGSRPGSAHRDRGRGWDGAALPGPGAEGPSGVGAASARGGPPGGPDLGTQPRSLPEDPSARGLDRGDAHPPGGRGPGGAGDPMNPDDEKIRTLLDRETTADVLRVPQGLRNLEGELRQASARIRACGVEDPFRADRLPEVPPAVVREALQAIRREGLMDEGTAWTGRRELLPSLAGRIERTFQRQVDLERDQPGGLGGRGR